MFDPQAIQDQTNEFIQKQIFDSLVLAPPSLDELFLKYPSSKELDWIFTLKPAQGLTLTTQ